MHKTFTRISSNPIPYPRSREKLNALIKAEKAIDRANKQKIAVRKLLNAEKEAERKARTRHLIQLGALLRLRT